MSEKSSKQMANILRDVILHGTARSALKLGRSDIAGKTGTTNEAKDAWFAGFSPKMVAVSWVGFDKPSSLGRVEYGGFAALPLWTAFMKHALAGTPDGGLMAQVVIIVHLAHHARPQLKPFPQVTLLRIRHKPQNRHHKQSPKIFFSFLDK